MSEFMGIVMKELTSTVLIFLMMGVSPAISLAGEIEDAQEQALMVMCLQ
jgi:hypothetical protein